MQKNKSIDNLLHDVLGKNVKRKVNYLKNYYNICTSEELFGAISPYLPKLNDEKIKSKALCSKYNKIRIKVQSKEVKVAKLKKLLQITKKDASIILNKLEVENPLTSSHTDNKSIMSLGSVKTNKPVKSFNFWKNKIIPNKSNGLYVIDNYDKAGSVFDQQDRGTCVANAVVSLLDYLSGNKYSREFLFHQCKMIDGIKDEDGTFMNIPFELLTKKNLIDYGVVPEKIWAYEGEVRSTPHHGPPPERCFSGTRLISSQVVSVRQSNIITDLKTLLLGSNYHEPTPVAMGFEIFESFNNQNSQKNGWITLPLPGEEMAGGHAMLIVGFDDENKVFLVRNSWSSGWATHNKYGYPGHAVIPYKYFEKYAYSGFTIIDFSQQIMGINEEERLYNKSVSKKTNFKKTAKARIINRKGKKIKTTIITIFILVIAFLVLIQFFPKEYYLIRYYIYELYMRAYTFISEIIK